MKKFYATLLQNELNSERIVIEMYTSFSKDLFRGLFLEGPIFGGAYLRREIRVSKSTGLAL